MKKSSISQVCFFSFHPLILFVLFLLTLNGCKKKEDEIPLVTVNFDISLNDPSFVDLNTVGGWVYVTGGVRGIIIYRRSMSEFYAYERNCPYKPNDSCARVSVQANNVSGKDDCCGSEFSITDGGLALKGPTTRPLLQYQATLNGHQVHVQN